MRFHTIRQTSSLVLFGCLLIPSLVASPLRASSKPTSEQPAHRLQQRLAALEAENADLQKTIARFRLGLEQAVAELNRLRARIPKAAVEHPPVAQATRPEATKEETKSPLEIGQRLLSLPRTSVEGRRAQVSGEISNPHRQHLRGTLIFELLRDGMPVKELRIPFEVPANGRAAYTQLFELEGYIAGSYSARVGFVYQ